MPQPKKKPDQREALLVQVRAGSLTPIQAERQAVCLGVAPLLVASPLSRADPLLEPHWSIPMALAWIMTRSPELVREASDKYRATTEIWQPLSDGGHEVKPRRRFCLMDFWTGWDQTWVELRSVLGAGALEAFGVSHNQTAHIPIPVYEWPSLDIVQEGERLAVRFARDQRAGYDDVYLLSDQVAAKWPPDECRPLPDKTYVSLTEGVTYIVEGDCRDDDYFIAAGKAHFLPRQLAWWSPASDGRADWLLPHLDLMRHGLSGPPSRDNEELVSGTFIDAVRWLTRRGQTAGDAYDEVKREVDRISAAEAAYARCYQRLFERVCPDGSATLLGTRYESRTKAQSGPHGPIPAEFFSLPVRHVRGMGWNGKGELAPEGSKELSDIINQTDTRPYYLDVQIPTATVIELRQQLAGAVSTPIVKRSRTPKPEKDAVLKVRLERALAFAKERSNREYALIAKQAVQQKKTYGFGVETLRKIYAGQYPALKKFGLKGIHG